MIALIFFLVVGLALLVAGGEMLVRGASSVASYFGMSNFLIGLTIVSLGTSAPELAICLGAALKGKPELALGNIVGSNIANVLLILGLTATVFPFVVQQRIIQREVPLMIATTILFLLLALDSTLNFGDGAILFAAMAVYWVWQFRTAKQVDLEPDGVAEKTGNDTQPELPRSGSHIALNVVWILIGVACLWIGARWMVAGASGLAEMMGVSKLVIGLTIVAIGTSAPEIVTSLLAARRGVPEMAVGGVIGSNISNLLLVGGLTALFSPIAVPAESLQFDMPIMLICAIACLPIFVSGHRIDRWEGLLFLCCFVGFTALLFVKPVMDEKFPTWSQLFWPIAIPLLLATVIAIAVHSFRSMSRKPAS